MKRLVLLAVVGMGGMGPAQQVQPAQVPSVTDPAATAKNLNLPVPANPKLPTLWLVGDSTVRNGHGDGAQGQWGWGEPLVTFFNPAKINVVNRAIGGRSSRSYINDGQWALTLGMIRAGDTVLFQWGHNDGGDPADPARARASLPGVGAETREIDNPVTKKHEVVHTFGFYLREYVEQTKAAGATPVICSLIPRKGFTAGKANRNRKDYAGWAEEVAAAEHIGFIDLNEMIAAQYDVLGPERVEPLFADPHTHTSLAGAEINAATVVRGLKGLAKDPVAGDFSAKGDAVR